MASFGKHFVMDEKQVLSQDAAIKKGTFYRITVLTDRLVRLEYSKGGNFNDRPTDLVINRNFSLPKFSVEENERYLTITTKYFVLEYVKERPFKGPSFAPDSNLKVKLLNTDKVWYYGHPEARNFKASSFSLDDFNGTGKKLDKGLYSTDGFVTIDDSSPLVINEQGVIVSEANDNIDIYLFMYKRDFGLCLKDYFTLTGKPLIIPRYALGIWWFRDRIYTASDTRRLVERFKENNIPINVLLLGEFWHTKDFQNINLRKTGYTFNTELFANPEGFIKTMHEMGVRVGLNIDPDEGIRVDEPAFKGYGKEMGIMPTETIPFNAFDKMFMLVYFEYIINPLLQFNVDFFWLDYKRDIRNLRALVNYHIRDFKRSAQRPMLFTRNPGVAAHRDGVLYSGETIVSWNTLKYLPFYNANASNIGISWWSHDVGGYKDGVEDGELYVRYVQLATFSPIFRFSAKRGLYYKREPWLWDYKTYNIVKTYTQFRMALIPYIYTEGYTYATTGMPLVQPLYYSYPELYDEDDYKNEYFFGSSLFVCPITKQKDKVMNRVIQRFFLPTGTWYDFATGKKYVGGKRYVGFYNDEDYPVFAKAGSIIPLANLNEESYNFCNNPYRMEIHIFPGRSNNYILYEDDGITKMYEEGYYIKTEIDYNYMENNYSVIIHPIEGKTKIIPDLRDYKIVFRNTKMADNVEIFIDGEKITENISFLEKNNDFIVKINDVPTVKQLTINCSGKDIEIDAARILNEDINSIISGLKIPTSLKETLARICFSDLEVKRKRIEIRKLKKKGLEPIYIKMFMKLYDYIADI